MSGLLSLLELFSKYGPMLQELAKYGPILMQLLKTFKDALDKAKNMEALTIADGDLDVALNQKVEDLAILVAHKMK
jgi:hypothetical protein